MRFRKDSPEKMANDLDDAMFDLDPYGYVDNISETGEPVEVTRTRNKAALAEAIRHRDRRALDDVRCTCEWIDDTEDKSIVKRFKSLLTRLENHYGSEKR